MMRVCFIALLLLSFSSCVADRRYHHPVVDQESPIVGIWITEGNDPNFGDVTVEMHIMDGGSLKMILFLDGGSQRSFPGKWVIEQNELVLLSRYFGVNGEDRVHWQINDEGVLLLRDKSGVEQEWFRKVKTGSAIII